MNIGLKRPTPGGITERPAKQAGIGNLALDDKKTTALLTILTKLCLSLDQQTRMLKMVILRCDKVQAASAFATLAKDATTEFSEKAKELPKEEVETTLGFRHIHVWNAWAVVAKEQWKEHGNEAMVKLVTDYETYIMAQPDPKKAVIAEVKFCRAAKCTTQTTRGSRPTSGRDHLLRSFGSK